jgi:hypothetical protein
LLPEKLASTRKISRLESVEAGRSVVPYATDGVGVWGEWVTAMTAVLTARSGNPRASAFTEGLPQ